MPAFELQGTGSEFRRTKTPEKTQHLETSTVIERQKLKLHSLSVDDLFDLRDQITKMLLDRVESEQRELESRLARLRDTQVRKTDGSPRRYSGRPSLLKGRKIPAKYRNPTNPSETWAGRGRLPKWLATAIEEGKQLTDFVIGDAPKSRHRNRGQSNNSHRIDE
jgi:DNA-binding protein H-NS